VKRDTTFVTLGAVLLFAGCASQDPQKDDDYKPEPIYRTGSSIPAKDYGAANIDVGKPDAANPLVRPGSSVVGKKPGG